MTRRWTVTLVLAVACLGPLTSGAATFRRVGFDEMVQRASLVVHGRVLKTESVWSAGTALSPGPAATDTRPPATTPPAPPVGEPVAPSPAPPVGVGTRGGRMIFTVVTMELLDALKGAPPRIVEFSVAGGTLDGRTAIVPGMPTFTAGEQYVVFLRDAYRSGADPIVGVNQGVFRVVPGPHGGADVVLDVESDFVIGVESGHVVVRRNPGRPSAAGHAPVMTPGPPPTPSDARGAATPSAEVQRYWFSAEPPLTVAQFGALVRARAGR